MLPAARLTPFVSLTPYPPGHFTEVHTVLHACSYWSTARLLQVYTDAMKVFVVSILFNFFISLINYLKEALSPMHALKGILS